MNAQDRKELRLLDRMKEAFEELAAEYFGDYEVELTNAERYVLVQRNLRSGLYWLTPSASLTYLLENVPREEYAEEWWPIEVVDLWTDRRTNVTQRIVYETEGRW